MADRSLPQLLVPATQDPQEATPESDSSECSQMAISSTPTQPGPLPPPQIPAKRKYPPSMPVMIPLPERRKVATVPDPANPLQDKHQLGMLEAFGVTDYCGLEKYIVQEARNQISSRGTAPRSYELIVEDWDTGTHHVYELLCLLPAAVIHSLIANTLPFDAIHEPEVKRFFRRQMAIKEADPCAGVYVQWMAHAARTVFSPAGADKEGKYLTSIQVAQMLDLVEGYLDNLPTSQAVNDAIDRAYNPNWRSSKERAKEIKGETRRQVEEWVAILRQQYCTSIDSAKDNDAFLRVPMEAGWAQDIPERIKGQDKAENTPPLLYLIKAIRRKSFPASSFVKQEALLFPTPFEDETPLYRIAEIVATELCSAYHFHGGYDAQWPGAFDNPTLGEDDIIWNNSGQAYLSRLDWGHLDKALSHIRDQARDLATAKELPARRAEHAKEERAYNEAMEQRASALERCQRLQGEYDRLEAEAAAIEQWSSPSTVEHREKAIQRQKVRDYLSMDESVGQATLDAAEAEIEEFDEDLVKEVVKGRKEAEARCRQQNEAARESRRKKKEKEEEEGRLDSF